MYVREAKLNEFLIDYFDKIVVDIPADQIATRPAGGGHTPVWVLGHLAIVGEMGLSMLGRPLMHEEWVPLFAPGSSDEVPNANSFSKQEFVDSIHNDYRELAAKLPGAPNEVLEAPHGVELLAGTQIETVADLELHLLTTHFSFHLAQLSAARRALGKPHLF